jgi:hypothetical protein
MLLGCGSGNGVVDPALEPLVGSWEATTFTVRHRDEDITADVLASGASFQLVIEGSGRYTATLRAFQVDNVEKGTLTVSGSSITFRPREPEPRDPVTSAWTLDGGVLTLDGPTDFDFNLDGTPEPALAHIEFRRT